MVPASQSTTLPPQHINQTHANLKNNNQVIKCTEQKTYNRNHQSSDEYKKTSDIKFLKRQNSLNSKIYLRCKKNSKYNKSTEGTEKTKEGQNTKGTDARNEQTKITKWFLPPMQKAGEKKKNHQQSSKTSWGQKTTNHHHLNNQTEGTYYSCSNQTKEWERYPNWFQYLYETFLPKNLRKRCQEWPAGRTEPQIKLLIQEPQGVTGYTDGSVTKDQSGWGFTGKKGATTIHEDCAAYTISTSSLTMEVEAVTHALQWIATRCDRPHMR